MLIPRFWFRADGEARSPRGERLPFSIWRGSLESLDDARQLAQAAADRFQRRIEGGEGLPPKYLYGDRPLREEILEEYTEEATGETTAVITRNHYGSLVLNTARLAFVDVDVPPVRPPGILQRWLRLLRMQPPQPQTDPTEEAFERLRNWLAEHPNWSVRVYRTRLGLRYLVTHAPLQPGSADSEAMMEAVGADRQYRVLCRVQQCFRARLSPKPWRCGCGVPPARFPWNEEAEEAAMREWEMQYARAARDWATCRFVETLGNPEVAAEFRPLVELHDLYTKAMSDAPLA